MLCKCQKKKKNAAGWEGRKGKDLRGKVTSFSRQDCDENVVAAGDFLHQLGETEVMVSIQCIEFLGEVEGDDCGVTASLECDFLFDCRHDLMLLLVLTLPTDQR